jgi:predicted ArsR family transcriptional regulator
MSEDGDGGGREVGGVTSADIDLTLDSFVLKLLRELTGAMEAVIGTEEASAYIARVGCVIGDWLNAAYHAELGPAAFDVPTVARIFVDLKDRIEGGFEVSRIEPDRIVLTNRRCPFGDYVKGRTPLCMMTSNVFGRIGAENFGYARVELDKTIARGDPGCLVVVHLRPVPGGAGREYRRTGG